MNMNNFVYIVKCVLGMVKSPTKRDVLIGLRFNDSSKGLVGMGSMGSAEPINFQLEVLEPINFFSFAAKNGR